MNEHWHLANDVKARQNGGVSRVLVWAKNVSGDDILQARVMEVAGKVATYKIIIDRFPEDIVECISGRWLAGADSEVRQPFDRPTRPPFLVEKS